jgi:hypothetical protein
VATATVNGSKWSVIMLPFMKDSETNSALGPNINVVMSNAQTETSTETPSCNYLTVSGRAQHVRNTTIFVVVMFILGVVTLGMMVKKSRPEMANAATTDTEEAKIEAAITRLTGVRSEMMDRMDNILEKFSEFSDVEQISVTELTKNPFQLEMFVQEGKEIMDDASQQDRAILLRQQMLKEAGALELLSIMNSEQGVRCVIDDAILSQGDLVKNFKVNRILERQVQLEWRPLGLEIPDSDRNNLNIVLKLSQ